MIALDVEMHGLQAFEKRVQFFPVATRKAAKLALNYGARRGRTLASREIRKQVNLSAAYLNAPGRLSVVQFASESSLTARIGARKRPTQLSRFAPKQLFRKGKTVGRKKAGISVRVKGAGGRRRKIRQAFFVRLKRGSADGGNLGIAVRNTEGLNLKKLGVVGSSAGAPGSGFQVLYGPSVDQVFRTVRNDILPEVNRLTGVEFDRQFTRLIR